MAFTVYDCREDIRNILVTPQIRARFLKREPGSGELNFGHSHDLGHEIFIVFSGRAEFRISGDIQELGPGQMCYALVDEPHSIRVIGDEPVYMYLSVTPHIQPTHTMYDEDQNRLPPLFRPSSDYDTETDSTAPVEELIGEHVETACILAELAQKNARLQEEKGAELKAALAAGDLEEASRLREAMWSPLLDLFKQVHQTADGWNTLSPRAGAIASL
jgi:mannose-6-phosphate isomerase-like protein (cupin superfamily)